MSNPPEFKSETVPLQVIDGGKATSKNVEAPYVGNDTVEVWTEVAPSTEQPSAPEPMENYAKDYVDQKFETERAKTDARFVEVLSEIRLLKQASLSKGQFWAGVATTVASILGVLLAVLALAGDRFDAGINMSDDIMRSQSEQLERDAAQDARLDQILTAIETLRQVQP